MYSNYWNNSNSRGFTYPSSLYNYSSSPWGNRYNNDYYSDLNRYVYGSRRRRLNYWERDNERRNRGRRRRNRSRRSPSPEPEPPKPEPPKPEPPKEELNKILNVESVNVYIDDNKEKHKTGKYACTEDRKDKAGNSVPAELVVRRGQVIKVGITFDRPFDKEKNDTKIGMSIGRYPNPTKGTHAVFEVDETGKKTFSPTEWGANLRSKSGNDILIEMHIPANCIVGEWNMFVETVSMGENKDGEKTTLVKKYKHEEDIYILFNPWCKDDGTYMETEDLLNEYVLNDQGCVYRGSSYGISAKSWNFGQFSDGILDAALSLVRSSFGDKIQEMSNPIMVSRAIAKMVNSSDDGGVLTGRWDGEYADGISPSKWMGSVKILQQYMDTGTPVKYGQCWVFSAITTTVSRALGLPCRSVTNFSSAHDTNKNNTIETYYNAESMEKMGHLSGDSVWNFHVWNECWLARPDLKDPEDPELKDGKMSGWQAFDATPQEASDGIYTCGPCPVIAIKKGLVNVGYDTGFVFSEVNADHKHWIVSGDKHYLDKKKSRKGRASIGKKISTKAPNGKPYKEVHYRHPMFERQRLDLTLEYKYTEGSKQEREAVKQARKLVRQKDRLSHDDHDSDDDLEIDKENMKIKLEHSNDVMIGDNLKIAVKVYNPDDDYSEKFTVALRVFPSTYNGERGPQLFEEKFDKYRLDPKTIEYFKSQVTADDYLAGVVEQYNMVIEAALFVFGKSGEPIYNTVTQHDFRFRTPDVEIKVLQAPQQGGPNDKTAILEVSFTNPLPYPLTGGVLDVDCNDMINEDLDNGIPQRDVDVKGIFRTEIPVTCSRPGEHTIVMNFDYDQLKDVNGSIPVIFY